MTIRRGLLLDPLMNPPWDVKESICTQYLKAKSLRHVTAVVAYENQVREASATNSQKASLVLLTFRDMTYRRTNKRLAMGKSDKRGE